MVRAGFEGRAGVVRAGRVRVRARHRPAPGDLYAGAFYKRYSGPAHGPGAIFRVGQDKTVELWAELSAGTDAHPTSGESDAWFGTAPAHRDMSWDKVGKAGLGSGKVDPDNENVYAVDLADKRLYRMPLGGDGDVADRTTIEYAGCANGDCRPFSIGFDRPGEVMYVGGVCSAETSQDKANLKAVVLRVSDPAGSPSFTPVLTVPPTASPSTSRRTSA